MTTDRELNKILEELGREHRAIRAPDKLELQLRAATGTGRYAAGSPVVRFAWTWAAVAILLAALGTAGVIWQTRKSHELQMQQVRSGPDVAPSVASGVAPRDAPGPMQPSRRVESVQPTSGPVRRPARERASLRASSPRRATWNSLDEFVALPVSEGLPPAAELSVVRIKLRGSDLQQYGLVAPPDAVAQTMLAEFVVGEDGLPRAIRIVR